MMAQGRIHSALQPSLRLLYHLREIATLLVLLVVTATLTVGLMITYAFTRSRTSAYSFILLWARTLIALFRVDLRVRGEENLDLESSRIYMSNHRSMADIPLLMKALPARLSFVSKKEIRDIPFLGWCMIVVNMIFIDRSDHEQARRSMEEAAAQVRSGVNVLIFPEGTRSRDTSLLPFKKGGFHMALAARRPIQPVVVRGSEALIPPGALAAYPGAAEILIGPPVEVLPDDSVESLRDRVRTEMERLIEEG